jgi:starch synthase
MAPPLKIAFLGSEAVPFVKSGGLADVVGALPKYLSARGHDVIVVLPKYASIDASRWTIEPFLSPLGVWMGDTEMVRGVHCDVCRSAIFLHRIKQIFRAQRHLP